MMIKRLFSLFVVLLFSNGITGCSTNPATGESQFTALMSPQQEVQVGAQEHQKILKQYGLYEDKNLQIYVSGIGQKIAQYTERPEVDYQFFLLDSPMVNAFALPGGYIYLTRGLLAVANNEAEMASVLAHETGHITARHSAERYSRGVVTSLGAMIISTAVGSAGVSEALGVGSDLYIKSYSRRQENQADSLGIRYLSRTGYPPSAMTSFLEGLRADTDLEARISGGKIGDGVNYFSTHPATTERINKTFMEVDRYAQQGVFNQRTYLKMIDGMIYGDSSAQGYVRGNNFFHPEIGFKFFVPDGYKIINQPAQIVAANKSGAVMVFDFANNNSQYSPTTFLNDIWMDGEEITNLQEINVNGMAGATASFKGAVNGRPMQIRLVAIQWSPKQIARFQVAIPSGTSKDKRMALRDATYSFMRMSQYEKNGLRPYRLKIVESKEGDNVSTLSSRMVFSDYRNERFRALNGLKQQDKIMPNRFYKIVVE